jgi:hypothetical protein
VNNELTIVFSFIKKLSSDETHLTAYKHIILKSVELAKLNHKNVLFYTDLETSKWLEELDVEKIIIDSSNFTYQDDMKLYLISILGQNHILVDVDLFLTKPLIIDNSYDLYVDYFDNANKKVYDLFYKEHLDKLIEGGIQKIIPDFGTDTVSIPNIGILYVKNSDMKADYIKMYSFIKQWIIDNGLYEDVGPAASLIVGQYCLGYINKSNRYSVYYCKYNTKNHYTHLVGRDIKFNLDILLNNILPSLNLNRLI